MKMQHLDNYGYTKLPQITAEDLEWFRSVINNRWKSRILTVYPNKAESLDKLDIINYHEIRNDLDHEKLWNKKERLFSADDIKKLKSTGFFNSLTKLFGPFTISPCVIDGKYFPGTEEVYWRLVSPTVASDVGGPHADQWFHLIDDLNGLNKDQQKVIRTLKVWIPIFCEPGSNGLLISEFSHKRDWRFKTELRNSKAYPIFDDNFEELNLELISTLPGEAIVFSEKLIHAGALNRGKFTRVSVELTLLF